VITVNVNSVNDAPVISLASTLTTDEDNEQTLSFTYADVDGDTVSASVTTAPLHGEASVDGDTVIYIPTADFNGADSFTLTLIDSAGYTSSQVITVNVNSVNDAPVISLASTLITDEDNEQTLSFTYADVDGDTVSASVTTAPLHGEASVDGDTVSYIPTADFNGADSFTLTLIDSAGYTSSQVITVNVNSVNDAPEAQADSFEVVTNTTNSYN
jgi:VCBS repeat-containing protein